MGTRRWLVAGVAALALMFVVSASAQAQTSSASDKSKAAKKDDAKKPSKPRGRLPAYYRHVVDESQREKIYALQAKYRKDSEQITAEIEKLTRDLRKKLADLKAEESKEVEDVLSAEQQKKVAALRAEAAEKRKQKAAAKKTSTSKKAS